MHTNGQLTANIADPNTGRAVGGYTGAQILPLIPFTAAPGDTVRIPLLVGTASYDPALGYAVPAGRWALFATQTARRAHPRHTAPASDRHRIAHPVEDQAVPRG